MGKPHFGISLGKILEGLRPIDGPRMAMTHALEELLTGALAYETVRDDGAAAKRYCLLAVAFVGKDLFFASMDGRKGPRDGSDDVPLARIEEAVAALPRGRKGSRQMERVMASQHATAGILIVAESGRGATNCAFAWNRALERGEAAFLLKAYFTSLIEGWTGKQ